MDIKKTKYDLTERLKKTSGIFMPVLSEVLGYIFLGQKRLRDGSYIRTCWLTFCYFPVAPLETYRITSNTEKGMFLKYYKIDEFLSFEKTPIQFDYFQAISSGLVVWVPAFSVLFFGFLNPLAALVGVLISVSGFGIYQLARTPKSDSQKIHSTIADLKSRLQENPKIEEPKVILETPVIEQSIPIPKPTYDQSLPPLPKAEEINYSQGGRFAAFTPDVKEEMVEEKRGIGLILLGILNILLIFTYLFYYGDFKISKEISGFTIWIYKIFLFLNKTRLLVLISFNLGLVIALLRSKILGIILILLSVGLFLNFDAKLWDYLYTCCLVG